jgi:hypothetical protein
MKKLIVFMMAFLFVFSVFGEKEADLDFDDLINFMEERGIEYSFPSDKELLDLVKDSQVSFMTIPEFMEMIDSEYGLRSYVGVASLSCSDYTGGPSYPFSCYWTHSGSYTGVNLTVYDTPGWDVFYTSFTAYYPFTGVNGNLGATYANWFIARVRAYNTTYVWNGFAWFPVLTYIGNTVQKSIRNCSGAVPCNW